MHEKCKNNIHRVTVAKWLEYCAPARVLQVRSTRQAKFPLSSYSQTWCKPNSIYLKRQQEYRCVGELSCLQLLSKWQNQSLPRQPTWPQPGNWVYLQGRNCCWNWMVTKYFHVIHNTCYAYYVSYAGHAVYENYKVLQSKHFNQFIHCKSSKSSFIHSYTIKVIMFLYF